MSQADFGEVGGVKIATQVRYESDKGFPDAAYLIALAAYGVDVLYLLTNERASGSLKNEEADLITAYRAMPDGDRRAVLRIVSSLANATHTEMLHEERRRYKPDGPDQS